MGIIILSLIAFQLDNDTWKTNHIFPLKPQQSINSQHNQLQTEPNFQQNYPNKYRVELQYYR